VWRAGEVAPPEVKRALEVALGCVAVVDGEVGHSEAVICPGQAFHGARDVLAFEFLEAARDDLGRCRLIILGEGEVQFAAHRGGVVMGRVGPVGDQRARVNARDGDKLAARRGGVQGEPCARAVADANLRPFRRGRVVRDEAKIASVSDRTASGLTLPTARITCSQ
jgi:hypothetical protein